MTTALESAMQRDRESLNRRMFEQMAEQFFRKWAPADKSDASEFNAEFYSLVRQIYMDAQEPVFKQLNALISSMPVFPFNLVPK